jgi:hypothetical protein
MEQSFPERCTDPVHCPAACKLGMVARDLHSFLRLAVSAAVMPSRGGREGGRKREREGRRGRGREKREKIY